MALTRAAHRRPGCSQEGAAVDGAGQAAVQQQQGAAPAPNVQQPIDMVVAATAAEKAALAGQRRYRPTPGAAVRREQQALPPVEYDPAAAGGLKRGAG